MNDAIAVVLAAGKGTRMNTDKPKVLCEALGRPLVSYVLDALARAAVSRVIMVVGYQAERVRETLSEREGLEYVEQTEQLGTGHAVKVCRALLESHKGPVLVLAGDSPMVQTSSLQSLLAEYERTRPACILGTIHKPDPTGLGRIVRDAEGQFQAIVEQREATDEQRLVTEVNMSTYLFDCQQLLHALSHLRGGNGQRECYLTDCPGILKGEGKDVRALPVLQPCEALSVNTVDELQVVEGEMRKLGY